MIKKYESPLKESNTYALRQFIKSLYIFYIIHFQ